MSRKADCWDAPSESFFNSLKNERVYQLRYETRTQARLDIVDWIEGSTIIDAYTRRSNIGSRHT
jgi:hypothetical protein